MIAYVWTSRDSARSKIGPTCPRCQTIHAADEVVAVGRFDPSGVHGYRARSGGPLRTTRVAVHEDLCWRRRHP